MSGTTTTGIFCGLLKNDSGEGAGKYTTHTLLYFWRTTTCVFFTSLSPACLPAGRHAVLCVKNKAGRSLNIENTTQEGLSPRHPA